jgi:hypothetical protein
MAPAQWVESPLANRIPTTIRVKEELAPASIIIVSRSDAPLAAAADFMLDFLRRAAGHRSPKVREK